MGVNYGGSGLGGLSLAFVSGGVAPIARALNTIYTAPAGVAPLMVRVGLQFVNDATGSPCYAYARFTQGGHVYATTVQEAGLSGVPNGTAYGSLFFICDPGTTYEVLSSASGTSTVTMKSWREATIA